MNGVLLWKLKVATLLKNRALACLPDIVHATTELLVCVATATSVREFPNIDVLGVSSPDPSGEEGGRRRWRRRKGIGLGFPLRLYLQFQFQDSGRTDTVRPVSTLRGS